jgi:hypothetical protein
MRVQPKAADTQVSSEKKTHETRMKIWLLAWLMAALLLPTAFAQRLYDGSGRQIGRVDAERFYNASGQQIGRIDGERVEVQREGQGTRRRHRKVPRQPHDEHRRHQPNDPHRDMEAQQQGDVVPVRDHADPHLDAGDKTEQQPEPSGLLGIAGGCD